MLVDAGADVNRADAQPFASFTPLMRAAANGNLTAVKLLLSKGAKVNAVSPPQTQKINGRPLVSGGLTPLLLAATYGPPEVVKALLDAGADVNAAEARGMTPLMLALTTDRLNPETVKILLEHGADASVKSLAGETALDWARKYAVVSVIEVLGGEQRPKQNSPPEAIAAASVIPNPQTPLLECLQRGDCWKSRALSFSSRAAALPATRNRTQPPPTLPPDLHARRAFTWTSAPRANGRSRLFLGSRRLVPRQWRARLELTLRCTSWKRWRGQDTRRIV